MCAVAASPHSQFAGGSQGPCSEENQRCGVLCAGAAAEEEERAAACAPRGPRLSMEALSFLEQNERELTMHPITLTFRSRGAGAAAQLWA